MRRSWPFESSAVFVLTLLACGSAAFAQAGKPWVDPPADLGTPPAAAEPAPNPVPPHTGAQIAPEAPRQAVPPSGSDSETRSAQPSQAAPAPQSPPAAQSAGPPRRAAPAEREAPAGTARPGGTQESALAERSRTAREFAVAYLRSWSGSNDQALELTAHFYGPHVMFHGRPMNLQRLAREKRRFVRRWPEREYRPQPDTVKATCEPDGMFCTVHVVFDFTATNPKRGRQTRGVGALQLVVSFAEGRPLITAENSMVLRQGRDRRNLAFEGASND